MSGDDDGAGAGSGARASLRRLADRVAGEDPAARRPATSGSYHFAPRGAQASNVWWMRERVASWLPPVSTDNEELQIYLRRRGWLHDLRS